MGGPGHAVTRCGPGQGVTCLVNLDGYSDGSDSEEEIGETEGGRWHGRAREPGFPYLLLLVRDAGMGCGPLFLPPLLRPPEETAPTPTPQKAQQLKMPPSPLPKSASSPTTETVAIPFDHLLCL